MNKNFQRSFKKFSDTLHIEADLIPGLLGRDSTSKTVEVPGRNGFVYVRLRNNSSELIQAYNNKIFPLFDLPVLVRREGNRYVVDSQDTQRYINWGSYSSYLPRHGTSHSFDGKGGGSDVVWVYSRQFEPMLVTPSGTMGGPNVIVNPYTLKDLNGNWKQVGGTGTADLIGYAPSGSNALMLLIYVDSVSGNPGLLVGGTFPATLTGTNDVVPYIPASTNPNHLPAAAVRLISGTTIIGWDNLYEARQFIPSIPSGTSGPQGPQGPTGTAGPQGPQGPAGAGNSGLVVWDEGTPIGTGTIFNFVGANVDASISGSVVRVFITGSTGGGSGSVISGGEGDLTHNVDGALAVAAGISAFPVITNSPLGLVSICGSVLGSSGSTIIDVNKNGTTIFTNQLKRPELVWNDPDGVAISLDPDVISVVTGDILTVDIDQAAIGAIGLGIAISRKIPTSSIGKIPIRATMWHDESNIIIGNGFHSTHDTNQDYIACDYQNVAADGDSFTHSFMLKDGIYNLYILGAGDSNNGKADWYVDNVLVASGQDWYTVAPTYNILVLVGGVSVVGSGRHVLKCIINGKNILSSGYYLPLSKYWLEPTTDSVDVE